MKTSEVNFHEFFVSTTFNFLAIYKNEPVKLSIACFNPLHCFTSICFHVNYQASHGTSIHMIHE